jgi:carbon storage regulator CsrA
MLVLTRKTTEQIRIGDNIVISVLKLKGNAVRIGIEAPRDIRVLRGELPTFDETMEVDSAEASQVSAPPTAPTDTNSEQAEEEAVSELEWEVLKKIASRRKCAPSLRRCSPKQRDVAPLASVMHRKSAVAVGE